MRLLYGGPRAELPPGNQDPGSPSLKGDNTMRQPDRGSVLLRHAVEILPQRQNERNPASALWDQAVGAAGQKQTS